MGIVVIGAGIGGPTAAARQPQTGPRIRAFEPSTRPGEVGVVIQTSANADAVIDHLDLRGRDAAGHRRP